MRMAYVKFVQHLVVLLNTDVWELGAAIFAGLVGGGGIGGLVVRAIMLRPERRKLNVDTLESSVEIINTLMDRVRILDADVVKAKADVNAARSEAHSASERADAFWTEVKALREQFAAATLSMAASRIEALGDFADMWDLLDVPVVFTSEGGRWDLVNVAMCRAIGASRDELLGFGWQRHVVDLDDTMQEEAAAARRRVWGYTNEWRHATETRTFWMEWYASAYKERKTMAFAFPARHRPVRARASGVRHNND